MLTWYLVNGAHWQLSIGGQIWDLALVHGAKTFEGVVVTWIDCLVEDGVTISEDLEVKQDLFGDLGNTVELEGKGAIVGGEDDAEEGGREARVGHACVERIRLY